MYILSELVQDEIRILRVGMRDFEVAEKEGAVERKVQVSQITRLGNTWPRAPNILVRSFVSWNRFPGNSFEYAPSSRF